MPHYRHRKIQDMNIKGLDYNTQREPLIMPEYGREIQSMVDFATTIKDKRQRQVCAETIVRMMEMKTPQIRENENYMQTLWDHLYIISRKQLDIEWPFDVSQAEKIMSRPQPMARPQKDEHVHIRHYGRLLEELFAKLKTMPEGPERDELARLTANHMKRDLATWGHGSMDDEKVADDLARFTDGKIQLDLSSFKFEKLDINMTPEPVKRKKRKG